jgi:hypothetical protein
MFLKSKTNPEQPKKEGKGRQKKKKSAPRETDVHLRQLAKKSTYVLFVIVFCCVFGRFSARGVRKHDKKMRTFPKVSSAKYFVGGFVYFFSPRLF